MQNLEQNDEILNNNLMFKLLNREKRIKELEQIVKDLNKSFELEINSQPIVKKLKQENGALQAYIDELEDEKLTKLDKEIDMRLKDLIKNNQKLKQENFKLLNTNKELIQKICSYNLEM